MCKIFTFLILNIILFLNPVFAYENFDECTKLKSLIKKNVHQLSLTEPYEKTIKRFGFQANEDYTIEKVHPDLFERLQENGQSLLPGDKITFINGKDISKLNGLDHEEFSKEKITLRTNRNDESLVLIKKLITSEEVDLLVKLNKISEINTKNSYFQGQLSFEKLWRDERIIPLGKSIYEEAVKLNQDAVEGHYFYCTGLNGFLKELNVDPPPIKISNLITDDSLKQVTDSIEIAYYPPIFCEPKYNFFSNRCSSNERENGVIKFTQKITLGGNFIQEFNFRSFPFDTQRLKVHFETDGKVRGLSDESRDWYNTFTNIHMTEDGRKGWSEVEELSNNEWKILNSGHIFDAIKLPHENSNEEINIPSLSLFLDIERNKFYYIFKIIFPILFILLITWSVLWISAKDLESRITISTVCLLTLIAYNFIIDQSLPKLSYLTFIDSFILISYLFAGIPTLQSVLAKFILEKYKRIASSKFDLYCRVLVPSAYVTSLAIITVYYIKFV